MNMESKNSNFTAAGDTMYGVDTTSADITATVVDAGTVALQQIGFYNKIGANNIIVDCFESQTINGALTKTVAPGKSLILLSTGSEFVIYGGNS